MKKNKESSVDEEITCPESIEMCEAPRRASVRRGILVSGDQIEEEPKSCKQGIIEFRGFSRLTTSNFSKVMKVNSEDVDYEIIWKQLAKEFHIQKPKLILSINGGAKKMKAIPQKLQNALKRGLMNVSNSGNIWLITSGFNVGVSKLVGEAMREYSLGNIGENLPVLLGIATYGSVYKREDLNLKDQGNLPFSQTDDDIEKMKAKSGGINMYAPNENSESDRDCLNTCCPMFTSQTNNFTRHTKKMFTVKVKKKNSYFNCENPGKGQALLDPNHTHFILFDDTQEETFNGEINFRSGFENYFQSKSTPVVQVVIEGGKVTLETTISTLNRGIPTVIIKGSGRCADLICDLLEGTDDQMHASEIEMKIDELLKKYKQRWNVSDEELSSHKIHLVKMCQENRKKLYVFNVDGVDEELDYHILQAVIHNSDFKIVDQLKLTMDMNRTDLAKTILSKGDLKTDCINKKMLKALKDGQSEFVELFLDHGSYIENFLIKEELVGLYENASKTTTGINLNHLTDMVKTRWHWNIPGSSNKEKEKETATKKLLLYGRVISKLTGNLVRNPYNFPDKSDEPVEDGRDKKVIYPPRDDDGNRKFTEHDLFLWAILLNRRDLVEIFWRMGKDHIGGALAACGIYRQMFKKAVEDCELELSKRFCENSEYFAKMAYDILSKAYERDKERTHDLLFRALPYYSDETVMSLADQCKCLEFLSHSAVQTKLGRIWMGDMNPQVPTWKIFLAFCNPLLFIRLVFPIKRIKIGEVVYGNENQNQNQNQIEDEDEDKDKNKDEDEDESDYNQPNKDKKKQPWEDVPFIRALYLFYTAPITKFLVSTICNIAFLMLLSYMTMVELRPYPSTNVRGTSNNSAVHDTCSSDFLNLRRCISHVELLVWFWFFTLVMEEIREIIVLEQPSILDKLQDWWSNGWNKFDVLIYVLFIGAIVSRFILARRKFQYIRNVYAVVMALFYLRFMQTYYANRILGPKVVMISKMMNDIAFFLMIFVIFLVAYGTAAQAIMNPNRKLNVKLIKHIFHQPYFQVYGELNLDELQNIEKLTSSATQTTLVFVLFAFYLLFTNILMLNLLIAMFGYTFQRMQDISAHIWAFKRRHLIFEYVERPMFGPPLNLYSIIYPLVSHFMKPCQSQFSKNDAVRKKRLSHNENRKMSAFEQQCMELVLADRKNDRRLQAQEKEKIRRLLELGDSREKESVGLSIRKIK